MCNEPYLSDFIAAGTAIATIVVTIIVSWYEYHLHKDRERSKVFSKLNKRYLENKDVQAVVKYLSQTGAKQEAPDDYQIELFLRFFEELGVYLKSKSLEPRPVEQLFGYYLHEIFTSDKGKTLLKVCDYKDEEWPYLVEFKGFMREADPERWKGI